MGLGLKKGFKKLGKGIGKAARGLSEGKLSKAGRGIGQAVKGVQQVFTEPSKKIRDNIVSPAISTTVDTVLGEPLEYLGESLAGPEPDLPEEAQVIALPDEEELLRNRRRTAAGRGGGRASTILSDSLG